jgi:hypothetical protein
VTLLCRRAAAELTSGDTLWKTTVGACGGAHLQNFVDTRNSLPWVLLVAPGSSVRSATKRISDDSAEKAGVGDDPREMPPPAGGAVGGGMAAVQRLKMVTLYDRGLKDFSSLSSLERGAFVLNDLDIYYEMEGGLGDYLVSGGHTSELEWLDDTLRRIGDTRSAAIMRELRSVTHMPQMNALCTRYYERHGRWKLFEAYAAQQGAELDWNPRGCRSAFRRRSGARSQQVVPGWVIIHKRDLSVHADLDTSSRADATLIHRSCSIRPDHPRPLIHPCTSA